MDVIYGLIPSMIFIGLVLVALLFWAVKSGQFDDFEGEGHRILMDEDFSAEDKKSTKDHTKNENNSEEDSSTEQLNKNKE